LRQTFKKGERLHSKKLIGFLFSEGKNFFVYPFKVFYATWPEKREFPAELLVSVSKKKHRKAVKRNKVKRLVREAYRKNKHLIYHELNGKNGTLLIGLIYIADDILDYKEIEKKIILILQRLKKNDEESDR
jgi:ribonuclease P protein component